MSDRILVMREGRQMAIFDHDEATQERVLAAAMGQPAISSLTATESTGPPRPKPSPRSIDWSPAVTRRAGQPVSDAILRRIRPEQFREVILLVVTIGLLLFFASQIPDYFDPRSVNRLTTGLAITAGRRRRAGAGRADPQHRPLGLLDGRPDGLCRSARC